MATQNRPAATKRFVDRGADYQGIFVGDADGANARLEFRSGGRIRHASCNTHARRGFVKAESHEPLLASQALSFYRQLYEVEERNVGLPAESVVGFASLSDGRSNTDRQRSFGTTHPPVGDRPQQLAVSGPPGSRPRASSVIQPGQQRPSSASGAAELPGGRVEQAGRGPAAAPDRAGTWLSVSAGFAARSLGGSPSVSWTKIVFRTANCFPRN